MSGEVANFDLFFRAPQATRKIMFKSMPTDAFCD